MKEYIKKFVNPSVGDNYSIESIPFMTSVETTGQNLVCNQPGKKLVNVSETLVIQSDGPEMIDLGLSVKWAKANLGATCEDTVESWYGGYYAWGETETKSDYSWATYKCANGAYDKLTKYCPSNKTYFWNGTGSPDNKLILDAVDDVVNAELGGNYRMPTKAECEELKALSNQWVTDYNGITGLNGRVFTGANGNTLFIPVAGYFDVYTNDSAGTDCLLWSSSLKSDDPSSAWNLYFNSGHIGPAYGNRCNGFSVRAVQQVSNS